jgi:transcriptional regulatory protein RtcR
MRRKTVVLGLLGTQLDSGKGAARWDRWRPSVDLCRHDDLIVDRFELLHERQFSAMAEGIAADIAHVSPETTVRRHAVEFHDPWDFEDVYGALLDFADGYPFAPEREDYLVHVTTGTHVAQICLFLLTESRRLPARLIQTSPPRRASQAGRPGSYAVIDLDLSKYDRLASRLRREHRDAASFLKSGIETRSPIFNALIDQIETVAIASRAPMLLMGPTGAGKSRLAARVYELKRRRQQLAGPFVEVNCATLRGDAAMSALFGHVRGAFTGATHDRPGLLRTADRGLLLLDEIGELGGDEQAMLLRAVEDRSFLPVGADREVRSDFQLIAGTNRDLAAEVAAGRFREDLFARINVWTFRLPGLAERREDVEPNLEHELDETARALNVRVRFSREARQRFLAFATSPATRWPGGFRDFNAAVLRMATLASGGRITEALVEAEIQRLEQNWTPADSDDERLHRLLAPETLASLDLFDRVQLEGVLRVCAASVSLSDAGRRLFAVSRQQKASVNDADRLRKYLARFGLSAGEVLGRPLPAP